MGDLAGLSINQTAASSHLCGQCRCLTAPTDRPLPLWAHPLEAARCLQGGHAIMQCAASLVRSTRCDLRACTITEHGRASAVGSSSKLHSSAPGPHPQASPPPQAPARAARAGRRPGQRQGSWPWWPCSCDDQGRVLGQGVGSVLGSLFVSTHFFYHSAAASKWLPTALASRLGAATAPTPDAGDAVYLGAGLALQGLQVIGDVGGVHPRAQAVLQGGGAVLGVHKGRPAWCDRQVGTRTALPGGHRQVGTRTSPAGGHRQSILGVAHRSSGASPPPSASGPPRCG